MSLSLLCVITTDGKNKTDHNFMLLFCKTTAVCSPTRESVSETSASAKASVFLAQRENA